MVFRCQNSRFCAQAVLGASAWIYYKIFGINMANCHPLDKNGTWLILMQANPKM